MLHGYWKEASSVHHLRWAARSVPWRCTDECLEKHIRCTFSKAAVIHLLASASFSFQRAWHACRRLALIPGCSWEEAFSSMTLHRRPIAFTLLVTLVAALPVAFSVDSSFLEANGYTDWIPGHATWYGDPHGEGSNGGACGYTELAGTPYGLSVAAGSAIIFQNGQGCGQCYDVKCSYSSCKQEPTRVVITDSCPGGTYCSTGEPAFDLSGMAMSNMALPGRDGELRNLGLYSIQYKRVPCYYPNQNIAFKVDAGSTPYWLSFTVKYQGGPGDIDSVEVRHGGSFEFQPMQHNWGANYMLICYSGKPFRGPYDVKITAKLNGHVLIAEHAIPEYFEPGGLYESNVQLAY